MCHNGDFLPVVHILRSMEKPPFILCPIRHGLPAPDLSLYMRAVAALYDYDTCASCSSTSRSKTLSRAKTLFIAADLAFRAR
jgi:hypothetical protein